MKIDMEKRAHCRRHCFRIVNIRGFWRGDNLFNAVPMRRTDDSTQISRVANVVYCENPLIFIGLKRGRRRKMRDRKSRLIRFETADFGQLFSRENVMLSDGHLRLMSGVELRGTPNPLCFKGRTKQFKHAFCSLHEKFLLLKAVFLYLQTSNMFLF